MTSTPSPRTPMSNRMDARRKVVDWTRNDGDGDDDAGSDTGSRVGGQHMTGHSLPRETVFMVC